MEFNSTVWQNPKSSESENDKLSMRQKMTEAVLKIIKGKSKTEIINLLGPGEESDYFLSTGRDLIYVLGPECSYYSIDSEWLLLWFDDQGILLKSEIYTD